MGEITACFTGKPVVITDGKTEKKNQKKQEASISGTAEAKRVDTIIQSALPHTASYSPLNCMYIRSPLTP